MVQSTFLRDSQRAREQAYRVSQARRRANPLLALRSGVRSHVGMRRKQNEDAFGMVETEDFCFYAVADGMGGHRGGARAADLAIETICASLVELSSVGLDDICAAVRQANERIFEESRSITSRSGMGTTLCGLLFKQTKLAVLNVGDSRAYRLRDGVLTRLTKDHTLAAEMREAENLSDLPKRARSSMSHILTRALGHTSYVDIDCDWYAERPQAGDVYLVCSDGLHGVLGTAEILAILQTHELRNAIEILISCVNERGGPDNVTVIAVEVGGEFPSHLLDDKVIENDDLMHSGEQDIRHAIGARRSKNPAPELPMQRENESASLGRALSPVGGADVVQPQQKHKQHQNRMSKSFILGASALFLFGFLVGILALYIF